jgi:uncharacterized protein (DUF3084 family)
MPIASLSEKAFHLLGAESDNDGLEVVWQEFERIFDQCTGLSTGLMDSETRLFKVNNDLQAMGESHHQALQVISEKDGQMADLSQALGYAQSMVQERDQQLSRMAEELNYANKIVAERDRQLQQLASEFEHADAVVKQRDRELQERNQQLQDMVVKMKDIREDHKRLQKIRSHLAVRIVVKLLSLDKK